MNADGRRLIVMRHAKAEPVAESDHARRLVDRGRRAAGEAGRWARDEGILPDHALVSTAARAHETWTAFAAAAALDLEPVLDRALYSAGPDSAMEVLRTVPPGAATVMIVGHNPTMAHLVHLLDDGDADAGAFTALSSGFPTAGVAVLEVGGEWTDLDVATCRISAFHAPGVSGS